MWSYAITRFACTFFTLHHGPRIQNASCAVQQVRPVAYYHPAKHQVRSPSARASAPVATVPKCWCVADLPTLPPPVPPCLPINPCKTQPRECVPLCSSSVRSMGLVESHTVAQGKWIRLWTAYGMQPTKFTMVSPQNLRWSAHKFTMAVPTLSGNHSSPTIHGIRTFLDSFDSPLSHGSDAPV